MEELTAKEQLQAIEEQISVEDGLHWEAIEQVLAALSEDKADGLYGKACYFDAYYMLSRGRVEDTLEYLDQSVKYMIGTPEEKELARCYNMFGVIAHFQNNFVLAMEQYEKSLEYAMKHNCVLDYILAIGNLADIFFRVGAYDLAVDSYEECLREYRNCNYNSTIDVVNYRKLMASYGYCLVKTGQLDRADRIAEDVLRMSCDMHSELASRLYIYTFLAFLNYKRNDKKRGKMMLRIAVEACMDLEQISSNFDVVMNLINVMCEAEQYEYLAELLHDLEGKAAMEQNAGFLSQFLAIHMRYFGDEMDTKEFRQNADMFFTVKTECEKQDNAQVLQMMYLRKHLQQIDNQQKELERVNNRLRFQVEHDALSGLCNKSYLNRYLEQVFEEAVQKQHALSILFLDIDYFKQMNDYYGHQKGDDCILALANALKKCMPNEFVARYGGDEFVVVMCGRSEAYVQMHVEDLLQYLEDLQIPHARSKVSVFMTVTIGIMHDIPQKYNRVWDFLSAADIALYQQKREQRGCARFFKE